MDPSRSPILRVHTLRASVNATEISLYPVRSRSTLHIEPRNTSAAGVLGSASSPDCTNESLSFTCSIRTTVPHLDVRYCRGELGSNSVGSLGKSRKKQHQRNLVVIMGRISRASSWRLPVIAMEQCRRQITYSYAPFMRGEAIPIKLATKCRRSSTISMR